MLLFKLANCFQQNRRNDVFSACCDTTEDKHSFTKASRGRLINKINFSLQKGVQGAIGA